MSRARTARPSNLCRWSSRPRALSAQFTTLRLRLRFLVASRRRKNSSTAARVRSPLPSAFLPFRPATPLPSSTWPARGRTWRTLDARWSGRRLGSLSTTACFASACSALRFRTTTLVGAGTTPGTRSAIAPTPRVPCGTRWGSSAPTRRWWRCCAPTTAASSRRFLDRLWRRAATAAAAANPLSLLLPLLLTTPPTPRSPPPRLLALRPLAPRRPLLPRRGTAALSPGAR